MHTSDLSCILLLAVTACFAKPLDYRKRYDLDGNGIPDWCYTDEACMAHCLQSNNIWTAFPATSCTVSSILESLTTLIKTVAATTTPLKTSSTVSTSYSLQTTSTTSPATSTKSTMSNTTSKTTTTSTSITTSKTTTTSKTSVTSATPSSVTIATATLPAPSQFASDKGTKWSVEYIGNLEFTDKLQSEGLGGDKCRTGKVGNQVIWNCGDMECNGDWTICGFSMGLAFYGTDSVMTVNTTGVVNVQDNSFLNAWSGDPAPVAPQTAFGMDTSNVVAINDTHSVAYAWEIWRGASDGSIVNRGNAVAAITLGATKPVATRVGPLLTGPDSIALGLLAILRDGNYVYTYSIGGPSNIVVCRVAADDSVFDASKYQCLSHGSSTNWVSGIPAGSTISIGATTANGGGQFGCSVYGSVFYSDYMGQYVIICDIYENFVNMYVSPTAYGPWSAEYGLMNSNTDAHVVGSYGSMVHIEYSNTNEIYFSMGPNSVFNMFKITFNY